ncbi:MAG: class II fructose-bisphosphate aldolase [Verrucomicrobia bacterium]|nr:class II fructose-bisphosphate aldolase [Verrucomicrobiota bacterium]
MMRKAREGKYAVGYFESWDIASLQGVLDAAEETGSPVIIGFSGDFMSKTERARPERLTLYAALAKAAAVSAGVPCATIFNECPRDEWVLKAINAGFDIVMPSDGNGDVADYLRRTSEIVYRAHAVGVAVEAELGELPCGGEGMIDSSRSQATDPTKAEWFVRKTSVDLLAISIGNVHILTKGRQGLDLARLDEIRRRVSVPLALNGGTGIEPDALREAIVRGVAKVNYGTGLKHCWLTAAREKLALKSSNPHRLLGMGGTEDVFEAERRAVYEEVLKRLSDLGCVGRAQAGVE